MVPWLVYEIPCRAERLAAARKPQLGWTKNKMDS